MIGRHFLAARRVCHGAVLVWVSVFLAAGSRGGRGRHRLVVVRRIVGRGLWNGHHAVVVAVVLSMLVFNGVKHERGNLMAGYSAMTFTWTVVVVGSV